MELNFNYLDIFVVGFIIFFAIRGYLAGFVKMCFGFVPPIAAIIAAKLLSPAITVMLRGSFVYDLIKDGVAQNIDLSSVLGAAASSAVESSPMGENALIQALNVPEFLKSSLLENNNPVVYDILNVSGIEDYISGYIANVCLNVLSVAVVFIVVYVGLKIAIKAMDIISKLPVINLFNTTGGIIAGALYALLLLWVISIVLVLFYSNPNFAPLFKLLGESTVAGFIYENNILLFLILGILG